MVIVKLMGGMGNQMFQYAFARNIAKKNSLELKIDLQFLLDRTPRENFTFRDYDLDLYPIIADFASKSELKKGRDLPKDIFGRVLRKLSPVQVIKEEVFTYDSNMLNVSADKVYIDGYWQNYKYFEDIRDDIIKEFSLKEELNEVQKELKHKINSCNSICLNVRRGDFVSNPDVSKVHGAKGTDYYKDGVSKISSLIDNGQVFVFSDDIEWCEKNLSFDLPTTFVSHKYKGRKFGVYLDLMKACKHFVIPNSTFAWWAAYLSDNDSKVVIAPKKWFAESDLDTSEIIPENWIKI